MKQTIAIDMQKRFNKHLMVTNSTTLFHMTLYKRDVYWPVTMQSESGHNKIMITIFIL